MSLADLARREAGTVLIEELPIALARERQEERDAVIAYLHEQAEEARDAGESWLRAAAYAVSRGEHRREETK